MTSLLSLAAAAIATAPPDMNSGGTFWMPPSASTIADPVDRIFYFIYWLSVFFFVLIVALMIWFTVKYRRPAGTPAGDAPSHHTQLEVTWTVIPLILAVILFYVGLKGYADMANVPQNAYEVNVTAQKWSWNFQHKEYGVQESGVLDVPAGRPVKLVMRSTDVLHSFFVPAFRCKQDVVPGRYTTVWFEAKEPGSYQAFCTEYCGTDHSQMTATVHAWDPADFERVMTKKENFLDELDPKDYPAYFLDYIYPRCVSCHNLDKAVKQGPGFGETASLWGKGRVMADGREVAVDENYVRRSMLEPQADIVANMPGVMATFQGQLTEKQIDAIIEFLKNYDSVLDENGVRRQ